MKASEVIEILEEKFKSGNDVEVSRVTITRQEFDALKYHLDTSEYKYHLDTSEYSLCPDCGKMSVRTKMSGAYCIHCEYCC